MKKFFLMGVIGIFVLSATFVFARGGYHGGNNPPSQNEIPLDGSHGGGNGTSHPLLRGKNQQNQYENTYENQYNRGIGLHENDNNNDDSDNPKPDDKKPLPPLNTGGPLLR